MTQRDWTLEIATHESAHCVALYLHGHPIDTVKVWKTDGSVRPASRPSEDPFGHAVVLLAGNAFMSALGLADDGDENDFVRASFLVAEQFLDHPGAAKEAFGIVAEAAHALVRTERFIELATALAPMLAKGYLHLGPEVERFLREHDPEPPTVQAHYRRPETHTAWPPTTPVARHFHSDGTVTVYSHGRRIAENVSEAESERLAREILG